MYFNDRESAAYLLLDKLQKYKDQNVVVAGIPRGAMGMAKILADGLNGELSAVLVHKIPSPENSEFAIGSVGISGHIHRDPYVFQYGIPESYIQDAARKQLSVLKERQKKYGLEKVSFKDRIVIIVDDGIATGATTMSAVHEVRAQNPKKIILATAVTAVDSAQKLEPLVDEFVALYRPRLFFAVGEFFNYFPQVTDDEVVELLHGKSTESGISFTG